MPFCRIIGAIGLEMIKLPVADAWNKNAPNIAPAIGVAIEFNDLVRLAIVRRRRRATAHRRGRAAEDDELNAGHHEDCSIRQGISELQGGLAAATW